VQQTLLDSPRGGSVGSAGKGSENMFSDSLRLPLALVTVLGVAPFAPADSFTDGLEGASINPYWAVVPYGYGAAALTNAASYSGSQSVLIAEGTQYPYGVWLQHDYGSQVSGSVSVWMLDNVFVGNGAALEIRDVNGFDLAVLQRISSGFVARVFPGPDEGDCFISTSGGWHQLEIDTGQTGVTLKLDGVSFCANPAITGFRYVAFEVWGNPGAAVSISTISVPASHRSTMCAFCTIRRRPFRAVLRSRLSYNSATTVATTPLLRRSCSMLSASRRFLP
jgi:hypothetical protein